MKALVIYDSYFGNTEQVAKAVGQAIGMAHRTATGIEPKDVPGSTEEVLTLRAPEVKPEHLSGLDLLVVGSPTRGFRPTEAMAAFLKGLPKGSLQGIRVAAFDTRLSIPDIDSKAVRWLVQTGGYAAKRIAGSLEKSGGELAAPPEGFLVTGEQGPLKEGELERAAAWATKL